MSGKNWHIYFTSEGAWEAMYADCEKAVVSIDLEQYIFNNDHIGQRFLGLLLKKAGEGVRVRMLLDAAGSFWLFHSGIPAEIKKSGVEIQFFNPIGPWQARHIFSWFLRDHRKILVIDSQIGYTGGVGINYRMNGWRDNQVRLIGPVVYQMEDVFQDMWLHVLHGGRAFLHGKHFSKRPNNNELFLLTNSPKFRERFFYYEFIKNIKRSSRMIYLTTPYFIPDLGFFRALRRAAKRGVDVRVLLSGKSDHQWVNVAASSYFGLALRGGIRVYEFKGKILHAKSAVVDGWASLGSSNLDNLSFYFNYEANLVSHDSRFVEEIKNSFLMDLDSSSEIKLEEWNRRSFSHKLLEMLTWPIHKFL